MAVIDHHFVSVTTIQTATTGVEVTGAVIPASEFTAGKKYLIYVTANISNTGAFGVNAATRHGSTDFSDSVCAALSTAGNEWYHYGYFTVWTAVASEDIKFFLAAGGGGTGQADQICMFMINLSDDLTENADWFYDQDGTDSGLTTTPVAGASVTFSAAGDWLVLAQARIDRTATTSTEQVRITRSGEASSSTPESIVLTASMTPVMTQQISCVFTTTSASNTFTEESTSTGTAHTRLDSGIFALNLNKFRTHTFIYTEGATATLSLTDFATLVQTLSITPAVAGDVWVGGYWGFDANNGSREANVRLQIDDVDQPDTQTADVYNIDAWSGSTSAISPINHNVVVSLTAASHTIDLDASVDASTGGPIAVHRLIWAVSMELPPAGGAAIGDLNKTLGALTCVATGGVPGASNLSQTLAPLTCVATGKVLNLGNTKTAAITLEWDVSVGAVGYRIYVGTASGDYDYPGSPFNIGNFTTYRLENFPNGTYYFAVTAVDIEAEESGYSNELVDTINAVDGLYLSSLGLEITAAGTVGPGAVVTSDGTLFQTLADLTATGTGTVVTIPTVPAVRYAPALRS